MESVPITFVSTADMLEDKLRIQNGLEWEEIGTDAR